MYDHHSHLHQGFYSYHDPRRWPSCRTCHLHTTRQANTILYKKDNGVGAQKCPEFKFKSCQVNDSSKSNQETGHLVSQTTLYSALALDWETVCCRLNDQNTKLSPRKTPYPDVDRRVSRQPVQSTSK
jgi:hypothetical protein